jgi:hypothetical protein
MKKMKMEAASPLTKIKMLEESDMRRAEDDQ